MQEQLTQLASARKSIESALAEDPNNMELIIDDLFSANYNIS